MRKIALLVLVIVALSSCRKEVYVEDEYEINFSANLYNGGWKRITPDELKDVHAICYFQNRIYIGGEFELSSGINYLARIEDDYSLTPIMLPVSNSTGVFDLERDNYRMMIGGEFTADASGNFENRGLYSMNGNGQFFTYDFCNVVNERVNGIIERFGNYFVFGNFVQSGVNPGTHMAALDGNYNLTSQSFTAPTELLGLAYYNGFYGIDNTLDLISGDGSTFSPELYPGHSAADKVYAVYEYNQRIYIFGKFFNGSCVKYKEGATWHEVPEVTQVGTGSVNFRFKEVHGDLFLLGSHFKLDDEKTTSVIYFDDYDWVSVGNLSTTARDIIYALGNYYVATQEGAYVYE